MLLKRFLFFVFILLAPCTLLQAQVNAVTNALSAYEGRPRVRALRLQAGEEINVDGRLNEPAWQRAIPASDFKQQDPKLGEPATEGTEVSFLFSGQSLYIGVVCHDSEPDRLIRNTKQRDGSLASDDRFQWTFDPYLDGRSSGYFFEVNPSGAMGDALLSLADTQTTGGTGASRAWDGIWIARVAITEVGWTIEIEIPFRTLKFDPQAPAWGVNFQRSIRRKNEETLWTGWPRNQGLFRMTNAGLLEGISEVSQGLGLNIQPYVTGSYTDAPRRNPTIDSLYKGDVGVDFIYSPTPRLKASFTVNTDFAETEVDQRVVNLTRFPTFFPERRTFFLEALPLFDFANEQANAIKPFFSRRIGLDDQGQVQTIDYGAKLTGRVATNDIGFLQVHTAKMDAIPGVRGVLPGEDFTILRAKQNIFRQSYLGMIYTRRDERDTVAQTRQTVGADFLLATSNFRGSENINLSGFYIHTTRPNTLNAPRAAAFGIRFEYPNDLWFVRFPFRELQPGYDPAVGFFDRRNYRRYDPDIQFSPRPKSRIVRRLLFRNDLEFITDLDNRLESRIIESSLLVELHSGDNARFFVFPTYDRLTKNFKIDTGLNTSVTLPGGSEYHFTRYRFQVSTAARRILSTTTTYEVGTYYSGHRRTFTWRIGLRPRPGLSVDLNNEWNRVELREGNFSTALLRLNANNQFGPWVSISNNLQFDTVSRILGWQARFRWIVRPGDDAYFVYSHNWRDDPTAGLLTLDRKAATKLIYTHSF